MPTIRAHVPNLTEGDADLAQRLGVAVTLQWDYLPPGVQDLILDQACVVETDRQPISSANNWLCSCGITSHNTAQPELDNGHKIGQHLRSRFSGVPGFMPRRNVPHLKHPCVTSRARRRAVNGVF